MFPRLSPEKIARLDVPGPRYTSYPTVPEWSDRFGPAEHEAALARAAQQPDAPLSLYVHIPFCREMCSYCGCNVVVARSPRKADPYLDSLDRELGLVAGHLGARRWLSRVHLGGGTPTFLDETQLERLWRMIRSRFELLPDAEVALEIEPTVTTEGQLRLLRSFGFNRLSMGVQDLDPHVQEGINRVQSFEDTRRMLALARDLGFRSVNFDLIYGLPRQTPESWGRTCDQIASLRPDRVSAFSFAYVPSVKPHQRLLPVADLPSGPAKLELFGVLHDRLSAAGYQPIGMDHFALPTDELAVAQREGRLWRDFQGYTTERAADTIGVGVSAISCVGGAYVQSEKLLSAYEARLAAGLLPTARGHVLSDDDQRRRRAITDLMCNFATTLDPRLFPDELDAMTPLVAEGLVELHRARVTLTPEGRLFVRNVAMVFDRYLGKGPERRFSRTV
jgi:oxygen-independent coproporphyrinogen III oxidase